VIGLTAGAGVLRFYGLARQGFWFDEASTALLVHLSPGQMLGLIPQTESTPPLYYLVAWIWTRGFGFGEAGLRSLSALAGVLVVPVAYGAAARLLGHRAGLIAAALTACNPLLIWYSQEARSYELLVLLTGVALLPSPTGASRRLSATCSSGRSPRRWPWPLTTTPSWRSRPRRRGWPSSTAASARSGSPSQPWWCAAWG